MNRSDESVERVLAGLRDTGAPAGMEQRVMRALEERAASRVRYGRGGRWIAVWMAGGCVAALIVAVAVVPAARRSSAPVRSQASSARVSSGTPSSPAAGEHVIYARQWVVERPVARARARVAVRRVAAPQSGSGLVATSRPAPPAPMTKEERLLLEVARRQDPKALELLNSEAQEKQEMEAKAEFDRFFGLPERKMSER